MKLSELMAGTQLGELSEKDVDVIGLTADSRAVASGFLFAGLQGFAVDGANYIPQAIEDGAVVILTHEGFEASVPDHIILIKHDDPRLLLAAFAANFYAPQPEFVVGVTGTNGKTSVASFVRQIWHGLGINGASLGTIGVVSDAGTKKLDHTTPDPVTLHRMMHELFEEGVDHLALEASSHGLAQRRLDGISFAAAAFTNITRDHLDYHGTFEAYFDEKKRLFTELLASGGLAIIDADAVGAGRIIELCEGQMINVMTVGHQGRFLHLKEVRRDGFSQVLTVQHHLGVSEIKLPLVGDFQASNALVAAALVAAVFVTAGEERLPDILAQLDNLEGARGRLEFAGAHSGSPVFIDYAHTPDALETAINALLPYKKSQLLVVFGCGGDRDKGKRPLMGEIASRLADVVIVTDDNPRGEDAGAIRAEVLAGTSGAMEIGDRGEAIEYAVSQLKDGDVLLVAGKGHETGQIVGKKVLHFSDHEAVEAALST